MQLDINFHHGDASKPLIIFIHGIGMDGSFWAAPEQARIFGGRYPLSSVLKGLELRTSFHDLAALDYPVLTWNQRAPSSAIAFAQEELRFILSEYAKKYAGIILIGHSRGGLIARTAASEAIPELVSAISIAAPHGGSQISSLTAALLPVTASITCMLNLLHKKEHRSVLHRIAAFLSSEGLREMRPGSEYISSLPESFSGGMQAHSIGGTDPGLFMIKDSNLSRRLAHLLPSPLIPDELCEGVGDTFVSAKRSVWPGAHSHMNFHAHHAAIVFNPDVRKHIISLVQKS